MNFCIFLKQALLALLAALYLAACSGRQPAPTPGPDSHAPVAVALPDATMKSDTFPRATLLERVACRNAPGLSYALYIPAVRDTSMPVLFFFDPHGDGTLPLRQYRALADLFHFILAGSNNSKNGNDWPATQETGQKLFADVQSRLSQAGTRRYLCGFSGGAKAAAFLALHESGINGVICAGAGLPDDEPAGNFAFSVTAMAGDGDMNMTDLVALNTALDRTTTRHRLILFNGKHAWPPADAMRIAFTGLQFDAMTTNLLPRNDSLIRAFAATSRKTVESLLAAHQLTGAARTSTLAAGMLNGLGTEAAWFLDKASAISADPAFQAQEAAGQSLFTLEQQQKQFFQQQFEQGDLVYWTRTIKDLQTRGTAPTAEGAMNQRLLAYLSLAFYSISNGLLRNGQNTPAAHFVQLYKMADASNTEAWYFSALLNARNQQMKAAEADLQKAVQLGFSDTARLYSQPEFVPLLTGLKGQVRKRK